MRQYDQLALELYSMTETPQEKPDQSRSEMVGIAYATSQGLTLFNELTARGMSEEEALQEAERKFAEVMSQDLDTTFNLA